MNEFRTERYCRRPFEVEAVQVTLENMVAAAEWCGGKVSYTTPKAEDVTKPAPYVKLEVYAPKNIRHTRAFIGDWIVKAESNDSYRVYPKRAFDASFSKS